MKYIPKIPDNQVIRNVVFTDKCMRKKLNGNYRLAISFEQSDFKSYEKKLEIFYNLNFEKYDCRIEGKGYKAGDIFIDSLRTEVKNEFKPDKFPITITGSIVEDTIYFSLSKITDSNRDKKVTVKLLFEQDTIFEYINGRFEETVTNGKGKAKLSVKKR